MKNLCFILKRLSATKLVERLGVKKANVNHWKNNKHIPKKHLEKIKEIKNELTDKINKRN
jgi:DNA-binding Xre family transcriptional regulator